MEIAASKPLIHGKSDTQSASETTSMSASVPAFVQQDYEASSHSFNLIQTLEDPRPSSLILSVRERPLSPKTSRRSTKSLGNQDASSKIKGAPEVCFPPHRDTSVSVVTKVTLSPVPDPIFTSVLHERHGFMEQRKHSLRHRNTLPSQTSQNLALPKSLITSIISPKHSRSASTALLIPQVASKCFANPSTIAASCPNTSSFLTKPLPSQNMTTASLSHKESANSESSLGASSMTSAQLSFLASLSSWRENISFLHTTTPSREESCSPILSYTSDEQNARISPSGLPSAKLTKIDGSKREVQSKAPQAPNTQRSLSISRTPSYVEGIEQELREISSELAASIKREMELEDLVERLQSEVQNATEHVDERTSNYFSDLDANSVKYSDESEAQQEKMSELRRKNEQSRAQMKLEYSTAVLEERAKRRELELQIRELQQGASDVDFASVNSIDVTKSRRELEHTCEELRIRLAEEQEVKTKSENLLSKLKSELQISRGERDHLRDEILPQLRSRVEGLEAQAAEHEKLTYEQIKLQQMLQEVKAENMNLMNAQRMQMEMHNQMKKFSMIAQSNEVKQKRVSANRGSHHITLSKPKPPIIKSSETKEALADRIKDVELQRDSLHLALKSLLERQEHQNREKQKIIKQLEMDLERAISRSPERLQYENEVKRLRSEANILRTRADEAITQKTQLEQNLTALKYELDRAEQEITSFKLLIFEQHMSKFSPRRSISGILASQTQENSGKDVQNTYLQSFEQIKSLRTESLNQETLEALRLLEQSLFSAISEKNMAYCEIELLRKHNRSLIENEKTFSNQEMVFTNELLDSAKRFEALASQVRQQIATNTKLRERLSSTIERGETEQRLCAEKILFLQNRVKLLEQQLCIAQNDSEQRLVIHEQDVGENRGNQVVQLHRIGEGIHSPVSSVFARSLKLPRTSVFLGSVGEDIKVAQLRQKISELEKALIEADQEMTNILSHVNGTQIQVLDLQNEREIAIRETKRLPVLINSDQTTDKVEKSEIIGPFPKIESI